MATFIGTRISGYDLEVAYEQNVIRIKNTSTLKECLDDVGAYKIAKTLKSNHARAYGSISISTTSLSIEILGHVYPGEVAEAIGSLGIPGITSAMKKVIKRTSVIDCGESQVDGNRWVWDVLEVSFYAIQNVVC